MAQPTRSLFHRIRCVKSSLDNAEQSFLDNKDIRGELDLMLAEAELKNLRNKKDVPWRWNRQLLAGCAAVLLALAGTGGWYFARDYYGASAAAEAGAMEIAAPAAVPVVETAKAAPAVVLQEGTDETLAREIPVQETRPRAAAVTISKAEMHRLVQSARVELSNSK